MKKISFVALAALLAIGAQATVVVKVQQSVPGTSGITPETLANYNCFFLSGTELRNAMGDDPTKDFAGVEAITAYLNDDFSVNYEKILKNSYSTLADPGEKYLDFRYGNDQMASRFGIVIYNPVDGSASGVEDITYFRVFYGDGKSAINDSAANSGIWASGWSATSAVPEPTSGLLLLLGVAGLALRRKQRC